MRNCSDIAIVLTKYRITRTSYEIVLACIVTLSAKNVERSVNFKNVSFLFIYYYLRLKTAPSLSCICCAFVRSMSARFIEMTKILIRYSTEVRKSVK